MQDLLTFAPALETQHFRLITMRSHIETLPLDYASYQVHIGQVNKAIETLEQGRGLLWSEMRGFRTSIDYLRIVDLPLAETFAGVNRVSTRRGIDDLKPCGCVDGQWRS